MLELHNAHNAALADVKRGRFGSPGASGVELHVRPEACVLHILGAPGCGDLQAELQATGYGAVRYFNPTQWFIVGDQPLPPAALEKLTRDLDGRASVSDQTHGRVRIGISGPRAADALAKGTGIDLELFPVGGSAMTLVGHISVNLARTGANDFELMVLRGYAESLWHDLVHMGLEYGVQCG